MMEETKKKIKLSDLIDLKFLQEFQDSFAKSVGVASIAVDDSGPLTKPSNFTNFCMHCTRKSKLGLKRCIKCDINWGKKAAEEGKPVIYSCHTGLTDFAVPIMVEGKHIASILGGQVLTEEPDEDHFRAIAKELGINGDEYINELKKIKLVPMEQVKSIADLLFLVANSISEIAHKNYAMIEKEKKENSYKHIIETVRSTLDLNIIKKIIVEEVGKNLDADRCFMLTINPATNKFFPLDENSMYSKDKNDKAILKFDGEDIKLKYISQKIKTLKDAIIMDIEDFIKSQKLEGSGIEEHFAKYNVKKAMYVPIFYSNTMYGVLCCHLSSDNESIFRNNIELTKIVVLQAGIAMHQNNLLRQAEKSAQRESLLRKITENIRNDMDLDRTLAFICAELVKLFDTQRVVVAEFCNSKESTEYFVRQEYKSKIDLKSIEDSKNSSKYWSEKILKSTDTLAFDNISESFAPEYFKADYEGIGVKAALCTAIKRNQNKWGMLALFEYNNTRHWTDEEINLLTTIANQIYISITQAELYARSKQQAQKVEEFLKSLPM